MAKSRETSKKKGPRRLDLWGERRSTYEAMGNLPCGKHRKHHSPVTRNDGNGNLDRRIKKYSSMRHLPAEARDNCRMEGGVEGVAIGHR